MSKFTLVKMSDPFDARLCSKYGSQPEGRRLAEGMMTRADIMSRLIQNPEVVRAISLKKIGELRLERRSD